MSKPSGLLVYGFGGHARSVANVALSIGVSKLVFVDANAKEGEMLMHFPVLRHWTDALKPGWAAFSASGKGVTRELHLEEFRERGFPIATLVAASATIGFGSSIGEGSFVGNAAHVGPLASIGSGCIINTGAIVEHECEIDEYTHISVNAVVAGRSKIGKFCMVGAGATVIDGVEVCDDVTIGAGGVAHASIAAPGVYVGVPARRTVKR